MNTEQLELQRQVSEQDGLDFQASQAWMVGNINMETRMVSMSIRDLYEVLSAEWEAGAGNCPGYRHGSLKAFQASKMVQDGMKKYREVYVQGMLDGQWDM